MAPVGLEGLGAGGEQGGQLLRRDLEIIFGRGFQNHRDAARHAHQWLVADIAGLGNDNLIPGADQRAQRHVNGLRAAYGHQDFGQRVVVHVVFPVHVAGNFPAELLQAAVGGVAGFARLQREDAGLADFPGCGEIRLAHPQRNHPLHGLGNVKVFADAGGGHLLYHRREDFFVVHHSR